MCIEPIHSSFVPSTWIDWLVSLVENKQMCIKAHTWDSILFPPWTHVKFNMSFWSSMLFQTIKFRPCPEYNIFYCCVCCLAFHTHIRKSLEFYVVGMMAIRYVFLVAPKCQEWNFLISPKNFLCMWYREIYCFTLGYRRLAIA